MAEPLDGVELRVFRSLLQEWDRDTVEEIRVELTRGVPVPTAEVEAALQRLAQRGYAEEFSEGHWRVTPQARAVEATLLGKRPTTNEPPTCDICGALITEERGGELVSRPGKPEPVWVHPACAGRVPGGQAAPSST